MMSKEKPADFNKRFDIVSCFVEHNGKFVLLRRHTHKANGDKWGLPAGKMDAGENTKQAVLRETEEETGLVLSENSVTHLDSVYVRDGSFDIEWHIFTTKLDSQPTITISPYEHSEYCWATPQEALQMDLIHDLSELIKVLYNV